MIIKSSFRRAVRPLARLQKVKESQKDAGVQLLGRPASGGRRGGREEAGGLCVTRWQA